MMGTPSDENASPQIPVQSTSAEKLRVSLSTCRLGVLLSGGGSTLQNLIDRIEAGSLPAEVALVLSSKRDAYGLTRAEQKGIPTRVVESKDFRVEKKTDWSAMSARITEILREAKVDLVVLAGFMCMYEVPEDLAGRVLNIHPALIPAFCGQGMYGERVHKAVVARGVKVTGCTVHFVTNEYDAGPIVLQKTCEVRDTDTPEEVQKRVFSLECEALPEAIRLFAEGGLSLDGSLVRVQLVPPARN